MTSDIISTQQVRIKGRVQGVFFRVWTKRKADELGLSGWVRNRLDGAVEAVFSGPEAQIKAMIEACHDGPKYASVDEVSVQPFEGEQPVGFEMKPTV